jgi:hypothetical protein
LSSRCRETRVQEYGFELTLSAHLEREREAIVSRQLGGSVAGHRVLDTVVVEPGPAFAERAAITSETIPAAAIEGPVGTGEAVGWRQAVDVHPERVREVVDRAIDVGFFERERRAGREYVRQSARYPDDWFGPILAVENKPDLSRPGALETQLLTDVHLALADEVVLATASHVTGAHLNRIPEAVGVWQFDPETGEREVVREATPLSTDETGVEILDRTPVRTDIHVATADEKRQARRRLAERAYGKGWRTYDRPACSQVTPDADDLPYCPWQGRVVRPVTDCGSDCDGHDPADPPPDETARLRAERTPWVADPDGRSRRQAGLDRFVGE